MSVLSDKRYVCYKCLRILISRDCKVCHITVEDKPENQFVKFSNVLLALKEVRKILPCMTYVGIKHCKSFKGQVKEYFDDCKEYCINCQVIELFGGGS